MAEVIYTVYAAQYGELSWVVDQFVRIKKEPYGYTISAQHIEVKQIKTQRIYDL